MDYRDDTITIDDHGITIAHHSALGRPRVIPFGAIRTVRLIPLRFGTGRHRLVGISPGRPRTYFHWDRHRRTKTTGVEVDIGRWVRIGLTPQDPHQVFELIQNNLDKNGSEPS